MILQRDMQMIKVIKVADNLFQVLLRIPDEMETELTGLFTLEYRPLAPSVGSPASGTAARCG